MTNVQMFAVATILLALVCFYLMWIERKSGRKAALEEARKIALGVMLLAEKKFGTDNGTGALKMDWAVKIVYATLPPPARFIIDEQGIHDFMDETYVQGKLFLQGLQTK